MRGAKYMLSGMVLLSWATVPFLGIKNIKRYLPSSIFMSLFIMMESYLAHKRNWWIIYKKLHPYLTGELPFIMGPFIVGSLWVFKISKGKFLIYMFVNLVVDIIFCYPLVTLLKKLGIAALDRLQHHQLLVLFLFKAALMYIYQFFIVEK
ncbi:hypothetical protein [Metabacillus fastidiosus]|uniref:hypothetical protein n=1 Tax=Metabacillus fastidiosus TaxID=1458 RepID=UPI002DBB3BFF|nr:hypothetical protein [Metabacillus fastidiosus]MEC2074600.1 hypothetical protein [Metabacillus fastidiosus]